MRPAAPRRLPWRLTAGLLSVLAVATASGCSGTSCDQLPALQAEREERRAAYLELARGDAGPEQTGRADEELHAFERQVYEIEQACAAR